MLVILAEGRIQRRVAGLGRRRSPQARIQLLLVWEGHIVRSLHMLRRALLHVVIEGVVEVGIRRSLAVLRVEGRMNLLRWRRLRLLLGRVLCELVLECGYHFVGRLLEDLRVEVGTSGLGLLLHHGLGRLRRRVHAGGGRDGIGGIVGARRRIVALRSVEGVKGLFMAEHNVPVAMN